MRSNVDDGKCVIDVFYGKAGNHDFASFLEIRNAAEKVMQSCIDTPKEPSEGGYVGGQGTSPRMSIGTTNPFSPYNAVNACKAFGETG